MLKVTDVDKKNSVGPYLYEDEIFAAITFLREQIKEIDHYLDRSLFFQNPQIIEGWAQLVRTICKIKKWEAPKNDEKWEERRETYVAYLLTMKEIRVQYQTICRAYYDRLKELLDFYSGIFLKDCVSPEVMVALYKDDYEKDLSEEDKLLDFFVNLNKNGHLANSHLLSTLAGFYDILVAIMNRGESYVLDLNPSEEDFAMAIDADLREWTLSFKEEMYEKMEEEISRHHMENRTDDIKPGLWSKMLDADEEALRLAIRQNLAKSDDVKQEHWGEDRKAEMDENWKLMHLIYSTSKNKELFDLSKAEKVKPFIDLLQPDNLSMFYDIIVRRSLIQCEMFPELKKQHEKWLKKSKEQPEDVEGTGLETARHSKLNEIIEILLKGNWKKPATEDNVEQLLNTVFGRDVSLLDEEDVALCEDMWALVEKRRGGYVKEMFPANLAGFFHDENLLIGSSKEIRDELFGKNNNQTNNYNKGKKGNRSEAFEKVIPFLKKYINKIIRQESF